ncbi:CAF17-like 4Fe-4S cluster assembly/insertion protein YgfZ [Pseudomonas sp. TTU2014-080ASC]|uniref:CAF17-like 4Fe-4S cluster assembly/insertion protein YgfZ n=1 Tax=Pseudomonas sp. TTU2014-080ASC TaxID=1729724 RepID=UPI000718A808|nr:folate-binding protein YgfZ [Pseudomonas sp. TTU2014-080ASC]KRW59434.1 aminomethyltransferase [Pseudomonas sp. TTU2014-080ASC]
MANSAFFCPLTHEGVLAVRGPDAGKFLQGQITCNIDYLSASQSSLGARCTPKGRMLSSFRIVRQSDGYLLALASELVESQLADLKKYAVFSKVTLSDASAEWVRFGIAAADALLAELGLPLAPETDAVVQQADLLAVRLPGGRAELWVSAEQADSVLARLRANLEEVPLNQWLLAQIRAGIGQVTGNTRELFIPQMINLQAVGGVSFKKGCYTGQEIVARMQYLGKLKRRLQRLEMSATELPQPGAELFSPVHNSSVGEVVLAANSESGIELLAVLQEDAVQDGRITLNSTEGHPVKLLDLPYTLDSDREIQR